MLKLFRRNSGDLEMRRPISVVDAVFPASDFKTFEEEKVSFFKKVFKKDVEMALSIFLVNILIWVKTVGVISLAMAGAHVTVFIISLGIFFWRLEKRSDEDPIKKTMKGVHEFLEHLGNR